MGHLALRLHAFRMRCPIRLAASVTRIPLHQHPTPSAVNVRGMNRFSVPPAAACVLAIAVLVLVVCVWISVGGGPWERFYSVLEVWTSIDSSVTSDTPAQRSATTARSTPGTGLESLWHIKHNLHRTGTAPASTHWIQGHSHLESPSA